MMNNKNTKIIDAAIRLFAEEGISVPTARIAKEAGVSNGTLFNYFATKQELIDGVYFAIKQKIADALIGDLDTQKDIKTLFLNIWTSYILWANKYPLEHQVVNLLKTSNILSANVKEAVDDFFVIIFKALDKGVKEKVFIDVPIAYLAEVAGAQMNAAIDYTQKNKLTKTQLETYIQISYQIYWKGISA